MDLLYLSIFALFLGPLQAFRRVRSVVNSEKGSSEIFLHPADLPLLPGEVEDVSTHIPSGIPSAADILPAAQPLTPAVNPRPMVEGAAAQKDEVRHGGLDQSGNRSGFVTCPFRDMLLYLSLSYFFSGLGKFQIQVAYLGPSHGHLSLLYIFLFKHRERLCFYMETSFF